MALIIRQMVATLQGDLVILTSAGIIYAQRSAEGDPQRKVWVEVPLTGIDDAQIVEVVARPSGHDGVLVARAADGRVFETYQAPRSPYGTRRWRELAGPEDSA
jgi:hypothetical protein